MDTHKTTDMCEAAYLLMMGAEMTVVKNCGLTRRFSFRSTPECKSYVYDYLFGDPVVELNSYVVCFYELENMDETTSSVNEHEVYLAQASHKTSENSEDTTEVQRKLKKAIRG